MYAVVYPAVMPFLSEFWASLEPQVSDGIHVCLSLDGVRYEEVRAVVGSGRTIRFIDSNRPVLAPKPNPVDIRRDALFTLTGEYAAIVLQDCDDVLMPGRVDAALTSLADHDVYACAMRIVDEAMVVVGVPDFTLDEDDVPELRQGALLSRVNVVGFGNSAYRSEVLRACLDVPSSAVLMDWLVASRAHLAGAEFDFDVEPRMFYRQYGRNTASVVPPFSEERILIDTHRVVEHYRTLLSTPFGSMRSAAPFERAKARSEQFLDWLEEPLTAGVSNMTRYLKRINATPRKTFLWWEHVAHDVPGGPTYS